MGYLPGTGALPTHRVFELVAQVGSEALQLGLNMDHDSSEIAPDRLASDNTHIAQMGRVPVQGFDEVKFQRLRFVVQIREMSRSGVSAPLSLALPLAEEFVGGGFNFSKMF
jgi:hypothetical protein